MYEYIDYRLTSREQLGFDFEKEVEQYLIDNGIPRGLIRGTPNIPYYWKRDVAKGHDISILHPHKSKVLVAIECKYLSNPTMTNTYYYGSWKNRFEKCTDAVLKIYVTNDKRNIPEKRVRKEIREDGKLLLEKHELVNRIKKLLDSIKTKTHSHFLNLYYTYSSITLHPSDSTSTDYFNDKEMKMHEHNGKNIEEMNV